jgi:putative addiction module antidote
LYEHVAEDHEDRQLRRGHPAQEVPARLRVDLGDTVYVSESPDDIRLTGANPDFEAKMALAEQIMREDRDILRVLAK